MYYCIDFVEIDNSRMTSYGSCKTFYFNTLEEAQKAYIIAREAMVEYDVDYMETIIDVSKSYEFDRTTREVCVTDILDQLYIDHKPWSNNGSPSEVEKMKNKLDAFIKRIDDGIENGTLTV